MDIWLSIIFLIGSFFLLKKGADWLVDGSASVGRRLGIPAMVVGLTIVAFGTSLPEFVVSIFSAILGSPDITTGNIVGSNIANIALILGISAIIMPIIVKDKTLIYETPFLLVSALLLLILSNDNNLFHKNTFTLGLFDGIVLLVVFAFFLFYIYKSSKEGSDSVEKEYASEYKKQGKLWKNIVFILLGLIALVAGGRMLVMSAVDLATFFGLSEKFIGLTVVAVGTSLPEFFTTVVALLKKENDIAFGNIIGSNIFNILWVMGVVSVIKEVTVNQFIVYFDIVIMIIISLVLILFATTGRRIGRIEGIILLGGYVAYVVYLLMLG